MQRKLESRIAYLHLIKLKNNDLNCKGGYKSNSSLYLTKNNTFISRLIKENKITNIVIVGRISKKFAYRIVSIKKIGNFYLFKTSESLFPIKRSKRCAWYDVGCKIKEATSTYYDWNFSLGYRYGASRVFDLTPVGQASVSYSFNPSVTVTASVQASLFDFNVKKVGISFDVAANLNAKLKLSLENVDYTWPEMAIIPEKRIAHFVVPAGPILIPGSFSFMIIRF